MPFISLRREDVEAMLHKLGLKSLEELFSHVPAEVRCARYNLPEGLSQCEAERLLRARAAQNKTADQMLCFLGAGAYDHYVPAPVRELLRRGEFYTAYTPYQPEAAQGILQALFEYQTMITRLTGLEAANASLYDGATATWEALLLAVRATGRTRVVVDANLHPNWREVLRTAGRGPGFELVEVPSGALQTGRDLRPVAEAVDPSTAAVIVPQIDFTGRVGDLSEPVKAAADHGALAVVVASPLGLTLFKSPGAYGAHVACGEGQELGLGLQGGGPYLGFFACRKSLIRRMPGRLVGLTVDSRGDRAFTLTLQTREQHIRREKATSNICTNQSLCAMAAGLYLALMGREGLRRCAASCLKGTALLRERLKEIPGVQLFPGVYWREFVFRTPVPALELCRAMRERGILAGLPVKEFLSWKGSRVFRGREGEAALWHEGDVLVAVTEKRSREDIDRYAAVLREVLNT